MLGREILPYFEKKVNRSVKNTGADAKNFGECENGREGKNRSGVSGFGLASRTALGGDKGDFVRVATYGT